MIFPAEWEPHRATWLGWPQETQDWPGKFSAVVWAFAEIVRELANHERVCVLVNSRAREQSARSVLARVEVDLKQIEFYRIATDRSWLRDSGPIFLRAAARGRVAVADFGFNGWGRYRNWTLDDQVPTRVAAARRMRMIRPVVGGRRVVLEGGAIDVDGRGTLLATEECLLDPRRQQRNPGFTRADYERVFRDYLGVTRVVWLGRGIVGDDTHGHVDDIARFVAPNVVLACVETSSRDANVLPLTENRRRLVAAKLEVVDLPMPEPPVVFEGRRLPASYANFYVANGVVLVPTFNRASDRKALDVIAACFPKRTVIGIHAVDIVWGLGTIHCLTQQEPL